APPYATITSSQIQNPQGLAADCCGWLYVANFDANSVAAFLSIFVNGSVNTDPWTSIQGGATGLQGPEGLSFDSSGNLFVANRRGSSGLGSITVYEGFAVPGQGPRNSPTPLNLPPDRTIQGPNTHLSHVLGVTIN